jgi:hypothetical protein
MTTTLEQYRQAKLDISKLHGAAKKELLTRFNELANELLLVQKELREEFGVKMTIPAKPKAPRAKKASEPAAKKVAPAAVKDTEKPQASGGIAAIEKKLAVQHRKLDEAAKAGKSDRLIKDRIYELEDELRLARDR